MIPSLRLSGLEVAARTLRFPAPLLSALGHSLAERFQKRKAVLLVSAEDQNRCPKGSDLERDLCWKETLSFHRYRYL